MAKVAPDGGAADAKAGQLAAVLGASEGAVKKVSFRSLFKFADNGDRTLMVLGAIGGIGSGVTLPLLSLILGDLTTDFVLATGAGEEAILAAGRKYGTLFGYLAVASAVAGFLQIACFTIAAERQALRIRRRYFDAVMRQDIAWFDTNNPGSLTSIISENVVLIRDAMGDKLGSLMQFTAMFITGYTVGLTNSWKLTMVIMAMAPLLGLGGFLIMKVMERATEGGLGAYASAGAVASEAFSMIRTVASYGLERRTGAAYRKHLKVAEASDEQSARAQGRGMGFLFGVMFLTYGLAFWSGARFVARDRNNAAEAFPPDDSINPLCSVGTVLTTEQALELACIFTASHSEVHLLTAGDVCNCAACFCGCMRVAESDPCVNGGTILATFFAVLMGSMALGQAGPSVSALANGRTAAAKVWLVIDRIPAIDSTSDKGRKLESLKGEIRLNDISFRYPARREVEIFNKVSLTIDAGTTVALVGGSGCGKSTVTQLVQRFYDPDAGSVTVDGVDLKDINLAWFRGKIALVPQMPLLFADTIAANVAYGVTDGVTASEDMIVQALKNANAYDFVSKFPKGIHTFCGEGGASLSGGQKQRIAIARAIIRDPTILILDEATSALDNESERVVQKALDELVQTKKRTTIVIAHRLSTVRGADKIIVMGPGEGVLEEGRHDDLLGREGHYAALVAAAERSQTSTSPPTSPSNAVQVSGVGGSTSAIARSGTNASAAGSSTAAAAPDGKDASSEKKQLKKVPIRRIFAFSRPELAWYVPAMLSAAINGATMPCFSLLFSNILTVYIEPTENLMMSEVNFYALMFVGLSVIVGLAYMGQYYSFGVISSRMGSRVRNEVFTKLLRMDVGYFDDPNNSVGSLTSKLATDATLVRAAVADRMALTVMNLITIIGGFAIAFTASWRVTLVLVGMLPLMVLGMVAEMMVMSGHMGGDQSALADSGQVLGESVAGIRSVTAFAMRKRLLELYVAKLEPASRSIVKKGLVAGAAVGIFAQGAMAVMYGVNFLAGSRFMVSDTNPLAFEDLLKAFFATTMIGFGLGNAAPMAGSVARAGAAVDSIFTILDEPSKVDPEAEEGKKEESMSGRDIVFQNVDFAYPTRPDSKVFDNFSLTIKGGSTVALVGQSGSGKSTCISLLERFYDPAAGKTTFCGIDTREANPAWLRSKLSLVLQNPELTADSVAANVANGIPDGMPAPTEDTIIQALKQANAWEFVEKLPQGIHTQITGDSLSGGQRQRICIARALIRDPEVLLLDEATSALDNESERVVQAAIEQLMADSKRTTIVIAHRLSTIQNADLIVAVDHGKVVEKGTHTELLEKGGVYAKLYHAQEQQNA